jgi:tetratricopeptide (TPR) repeat protein
VPRGIVFISYSHADKDRPWLGRLGVHLKRLETSGLIRRWDDTRIEAGDRWRLQIEKALESAVAAVLIITEDFLTSEFISQYELPPLLAAEADGLLVVPVIARPCSYLEHPELKQFQAINSPDIALRMSEDDQEAVWQKVVSLIERKLKQERRELEPRLQAPLMRSEVPPLAPHIFGRGKVMEKIRGFMTDTSRNVAIVQGLYGVGKSAITAKMAELAGKYPEDVFWLTCRADLATVDVLLSALAVFFSERGDSSLLHIWSDPDPVQFAEKLHRLVMALRAHPYLLVFDQYEDWLNAELQVRDDQVAAVLTAIFRGPHKSKVMLITRKRPLFDPTANVMPWGSYVEEQIPALNKTEAMELLRLRSPELDETLLEKLAEAFGGNPQILRIVSDQIRIGSCDPEDLLEPENVENGFPQLLASAIDELPPESREALNLLAIVRQPLNRKQVADLGISFAATVRPLIARFLVLLDLSTQRVEVEGLVRTAVVGSLNSKLRTELNTRAGEFWSRSGAALQGEPAMERIKFAVEEAFHRRENGDFISAARAIAGIAGLLIDRGYLDQAQENLDLILANPADDYSRARAFAGLGRIADRRGKSDAALVHLNSALALFEATADYAEIAASLCRIGRIHNARGDLDDAETSLLKCIAVCEKHGTTAGRAGAELSLGWNHQQRGKPLEDVLRYYGLAIKHAEEAKDWAILCAACRNMGFLFWDKKRDQDKCREAYERAREVAEKHDIAKDLDSIGIDLAYLSTEWGDPKAGEEFARRAIESCTKGGNKYGLANAYCNLGKALEAQERWPDAASAYDEGRRLSAAVRNFGGEVFAERGQARLYHRAGEIAEAQSLLRKAIERLKGRGMPDLLAKLEKELQEMKN